MPIPHIAKTLSADSLARTAWRLYASDRIVRTFEHELEAYMAGNRRARAAFERGETLAIRIEQLPLEGVTKSPPSVSPPSSAAFPLLIPCGPSLP
jgi:hypothetical protein